jgi:uncharacterized membrane protein YkoI
MFNRVAKVTAFAGASLLAMGIADNAVADADTAKALGAAKLSLTQAIEAAEKQGGGKAIDAEFERTNNGPRYDVKVLGTDKLVEYTLDANTGKVVGTDNEVIEKYFTRLTPDQVRGAKTTLAQAIGIAEQRSGGRAYEAEVDREGEAVEYDVTVFKADGSEHEIEISGDGQVKSR